jgi:hypothetical protein
MASPGSNPYSYFTPTNYWNSEAGKMFQNAQFGLDTSSGKRDTKKVIDNLEKNPFAMGTESVQFPGLPGYEVAGNINADSYKSLINELEKKTFLSDFKQQLLGLGSGVAFSAATLPYVERLRNLDYQLGLNADIQSPTRQVARDVARQGQLATAADATTNRLNALAQLRQAAASGVNISV